jgi:AcrR family transcriptional regulator
LPATRRRRARDLLEPGLEPIDLERIVAAALAILDHGGLDRLSMRNVADRLGIHAATLYWYIEGKPELLSLLAESICQEIKAPPGMTPWRRRLEALMGQYRRVLLAHRDAAHVLAATPPAGAHRLRLVDIAMEAILDAGFRGAEAVRAGRLLVDYTTGFVQEESIAATRTANSEPQPGRSDGRLKLLPTFADIAPREYPSIAALGPHLTADAPDARFKFGLSVILDGLEQRRARGQG